MNDSAASVGATRFRKQASNLAPIVLWVFAAIWYVSIGAMLLVVWRGGTAPLVIVGFFAAAGLPVVWRATRATFSATRFRGAEIELQSPGLLGGRIAGVLRVPQHVLKHDSLKFRMTAWHRMSESPDTLLWETTEPVSRPGPGAGQMVTLPFSIRLPLDAVPTNVAVGSFSNYWRLELRSKQGSVGFEVPVQRPAQ